MKIKKILGILTSAVMSATLVSAPSISAEDVTSNSNWETDTYYVSMMNVTDDGIRTQWYTTDDMSFRKDGLHVKYQDTDVTDESTMTFPDGVTPSNTYDYQNFDYIFPVTISHNGNDMAADVNTKIGQPGDINTDHVVNVCDPALIARDLANYRAKKKSTVPAFGRFLATGNRNENFYDLNSKTASTIADKLAKHALGIHQKGNNAENTNSESPYSLSLSNAAGVPGEQVTIQVVVSADNKFEGLDAVIEWEGGVIKLDPALAAGGTTVSSVAGDGVVALVDYGDRAINNGAVASVSFTIPEEAVPGENIDVNFSELRTFSVLASDGTSKDVTDIVNVKGTSVKVNKPTESKTSGTTPATTTSQNTSSTTVSSTVTTTAANSTAAQSSSTRASVTTVNSSTIVSSGTVSNTIVSSTAAITSSSTTQRPISIITIPETTSTKEIVEAEPYCSINVVSPPTRTKFNVGEKLNLNGLKVDVYYAPGGEIPAEDLNKYTKVAANAVPMDNPDMFTVDTSKVDMNTAGKYKVSIGLTQAAQDMFWYCNPVEIDIEVAEQQITTASSTTLAQSSSTQTTTTAVVTTAPAVTYQRGDANHDGKVNVSDAAFIASMLALHKSSKLPESADYNMDAKVNIMDAVAIAKMCANKRK